MITQLQTQTKAAQQPSFISAQTGLLQRKCACGQHTIGGSECEECRQKREGTLQRAAVNTAPTSSVPPIVRDVLAWPARCSRVSMSHHQQLRELSQPIMLLYRDRRLLVLLKKVRHPPLPRQI